MKCTDTLGVPKGVSRAVPRCLQTAPTCVVFGCQPDRLCHVLTCASTFQHSGYGVYIYPNSFFRYEGEWKGGKTHGKKRPWPLPTAASSRAQPVSSGSLGWAGGTGASCSGPSRSHCGRGKATSCSTGAREPRRPGAAPAARSKARQRRRGWSATFSQAAGPQAGTPPWALVPLCQSKSNGGDFTADP